MNDLIGEIASVEMPSVFNPWRHSDELDRFQAEGPLLRIERLRAHFDCRPRFLLIGEAPGYQGCHFSGVPFTNEKLIHEGRVPRVPATRFTLRDKPWCEPSATIVWGTLHDLDIAADVVMWNAFAWHPHLEGNAYSNRTPTRNELQAGAPILRKVVAHFAGVPVIAIGQKAKTLLWNLDVKTMGSVRHPSMGGANDYRRQMAELLQAS